MANVRMTSAVQFVRRRFKELDNQYQSSLPKHNDNNDTKYDSSVYVSVDNHNGS